MTGKIHLIIHTHRSNVVKLIKTDLIVELFFYIRSKAQLK